ncbi:penicillin-binding protein [Acidovorax sp. Root267]|uniref:transglycosylase domain-containing protein n=1 Tax=Acidovorax sp. Root267 TaxID=1736505 RepID=UPI00070ACFBD|nr:transglycosylase domain-containing protein [Acidovorax sp. Root267]KRD18264.1 penicillin-binding protein [Acidovorax sp. Root267]
MRTLLLSFQARAAALFRWLAGLFAWMPRPLRRALMWGALALPATVLVYTLALIPFTPSISDIRKAKSELPAQLMSVDGKLLAEYRWANREWVELNQISPNVVNALIATEDHRFYDHFGLDWRRTASSVVHTLRGDPQGGSTITQQLARNLFPEEIGRSRVFPQALTRKLKEAITAVKIEVSYTKDEILETYLNTVPFLYNAFGIEMAARTYFDKSADKLNVLESATLIGMLKGTAYYNPVLNPERAQARRNTVLSQMVKRGKLEEKQLEALQKRPLRVNFERQTEVMGPAPHFAMQLRKQLIAWADSNGYNLYSDGLVIRTTIDSRLQAIANQAVARQGRQLQGVADTAWSQRNGWGPKSELVQTLVRESAEYRAAVDKGQAPEEALQALLDDTTFLQKLRAEKTRVQAGFLAQDPVTGHVLAWVGSRDFAQDPFDHVQAARRQPGSTFKPFVYGAAFASGASPDDTLMDAAVEIPLGGGRVWRPTDGGAPSDQPMTLGDGLAFSKNTITAQVMQQVGPARVAEVARALGVRQSPLEEVPSLALGTSPVTLKEMVTAYSSIANLGRYVEPVLITRIEDRHGKVLETFAPSAPEEVFEPRAAQTLRNAMRGAIDKGTATAIRSRYGIQADVAGKTGTTQDNTDGWFILMHARVVAGAWAGFNDGRITLRSDHWGQGARSALPMVGEFMQQAIRAKVINGNDRFVDEFVDAPPPPADGSLGAMRDWIRGLFGGNPQSPPVPAPWPGTPPRPGSDGLPPVTTDPAGSSRPPVPPEERVGG